MLPYGTHSLTPLEPDHSFFTTSLRKAEWSPRRRRIHFITTTHKRRIPTLRLVRPSLSLPAFLCVRSLTSAPTPRRDSTVSELLLSLRDLAPSLRANPLARYSLRLIFYDPQLSRFTSRELATLSARDLLPSNAGGQGGRRTLDDVRFVVGDWVDVAYYSEPRAGGFGAPLPSSLGGGGGGGMNGGRDALPHFGANAPRGGPGGFSIRGGFGANAGPPSRGGPVAGAPSVPTAREAWGPAPVPGGMGGHGQGRGDGRGREAGIGFGSAGRGGGYSGGGDRRPADGGWGSRGGGGGGGRDRDAPPPRDRDAPRRDDRVRLSLFLSLCAR